MTWDIQLPSRGCNKTYYVQKLREFKAELVDESAQFSDKEAHCGLLSSAKEEFKKMVMNVRNWAEEIQSGYSSSDYGFKLCRKLKIATNWSHHASKAYGNQTTIVDEEYMDLTLKLMQQVKQYLFHGECDGSDSLISGMSNVSIN